MIEHIADTFLELKMDESRTKKIIRKLNIVHKLWLRKQDSFLIFFLLQHKIFTTPVITKLDQNITKKIGWPPDFVSNAQGLAIYGSAVRGRGNTGKPLLTKDIFAYLFSGL